MKRKKKVKNEYSCDEAMIDMLKGLEIFRGIQDSSFESALSIIEPYYGDYKKNDMLVRENEIFPKLAVVYRGKFVAVRNDYVGKSVVIKEYGQGEIIGLNIVFSRTKKSPTVVQAIGQTNRVLFIDLKSVLSPTYPDRGFQYILHENLLRAVSEDSIKNIYKIDIITKKTIRERLLAYLFTVMKKNGDTAFRIEMDRERLAQYLGVTRSALSHELSKMRNDDLIECNRDWFELKEKCISQYKNATPQYAKGEEDNTDI